MKIDTSIEKFKALDACHQQIQHFLRELALLLQRVDAGRDDEQCRQQAGAIESFFSSTSRQHHADEEKNVFPALLTSDNTEMVQAVLTLQQDHGWIEENWIELGPMLRSMAAGNDYIDVAEFRHSVEVFLELCSDHIALEESLIYPEYKARLARELASRAARTGAST